MSKAVNARSVYEGARNLLPIIYEPPELLVAPGGASK
jgi:hypothetical protein